MLNDSLCKNHQGKTALQIAKELEPEEDMDADDMADLPRGYGDRGPPRGGRRVEYVEYGDREYGDRGPPRRGRYSPRGRYPQEDYRQKIVEILEKP